MMRFQPIRSGRPRGFTAVAVVCLILLAMLAFVQVAHVHQSASDADNCQLCIAMHSAAPVAVAAAVILLVELGAPAPVLRVHIIAHTWHPSLFTRPPPAF